MEKQLFNTILGLAEIMSIKEDETKYPYQLTPIQFTEKEMRRLNIGKHDTYFHITKNGDKVSELIFRKGVFSSSTKDMNTKRYVTLLTYDEKKYSDDIVKICKLESPYHLESHNCVFDMEKHEIAFKTSDTLNDYITVYENVCISKISDGVFFLPDRRWILDNSNNLDGSVDTKRHLYAYSEKYNSDKAVMYRIDKTTGEVVNCNEIE